MKKRTSTEQLVENAGSESRDSGSRKNVEAERNERTETTFVHKARASAHRFKEQDKHSEKHKQLHYSQNNANQRFVKVLKLPKE